MTTLCQVYSKVSLGILFGMPKPPNVLCGAFLVSGRVQLAIHAKRYVSLDLVPEALQVMSRVTKSGLIIADFIAPTAIQSLVPTGLNIDLLVWRATLLHFDGGVQCFDAGGSGAGAGECETDVRALRIESATVVARRFDLLGLEHDKRDIAVVFIKFRPVVPCVPQDASYISLRIIKQLPGLIQSRVEHRALPVLHCIFAVLPSPRVVEGIDCQGIGLA